MDWTLQEKCPICEKEKQELTKIVARILVMGCGHWVCYSHYMTNSKIECELCPAH